MCLRTNVIIISIISNFLNILASLEIMDTSKVQFSSETTTWAILLYSGSIGLSVGLKIVVYTILIVSTTLCLLGAIKNEKYLLIPFIIVMIIQTVTVIVFWIFYFWGTKYAQFIESRVVEGQFYFSFIILLRFRQSIALYFGTVTAQFYQELSPLCGTGCFPTGEVVSVEHIQKAVPHYQQQPPTTTHKNCKKFMYEGVYGVNMDENSSE